MISVIVIGETGNWLNQYCPRNGVRYLYQNYMEMQVSAGVRNAFRQGID
jgi:hypothetical protein